LYIAGCIESVVDGMGAGMEREANPLMLLEKG
jgi:hypothetical protein